MSQIHGLVFLIKREGEEGKLGKIKSALQVFTGSPIIAEFVKERGYYEGAKEEWELFMDEHRNPDIVAGDVDGDGDYDSADRAIINKAE